MLGFYYDPGMCSGCRTCQMACKDKNDLPVGTNLRTVTTYQYGEFPDAKIFHFSASCNHCEHPACMAACPSGAIYKNEDGIVLIDSEMCDGCGACVEICPYGHPQLVDGVAVKCDSCIGIRANGNLPACVASCNMRCLDFGDVDELKAKYGDEFVSSFAFQPDPALTEPRTLLKACEKADHAEAEVCFW